MGASIPSSSSFVIPEGIFLVIRIPPHVGALGSVRRSKLSTPLPSISFDMADFPRRSCGSYGSTPFQSRREKVACDVVPTKLSGHGSLHGGDPLHEPRHRSTQETIPTLSTSTIYTPPYSTPRTGPSPHLNIHISDLSAARLHLMQHCLCVYWWNKAAQETPPCALPSCPSSHPAASVEIRPSPSGPGSTRQSRPP